MHLYLVKYDQLYLRKDNPPTSLSTENLAL
jgi:hypothetical protein